MFIKQRRTTKNWTVSKTWKREKRSRKNPRGTKEKRRGITETRRRRIKEKARGNFRKNKENNSDDEITKYLKDLNLKYAYFTSLTFVNSPKSINAEFINQGTQIITNIMNEKNQVYLIKIFWMFGIHNLLTLPKKFQKRLLTILL